MSRRGVKRIASLINEHGLTSAAMSITPYPLVRETLSTDVLFPVSEDDIQQIAAGEAPCLQHAFWFEIPRDLPEATIRPLQEAGALVIPAIYQHRYPRGGHEILAQADIRRLLAAGVDGFQIDSVYRNAFPSRP